MLTNAHLAVANAPRNAVVQLRHALDFGEGDQLAILHWRQHLHGVLMPPAAGRRSWGDPPVHIMSCRPIEHIMQDAQRESMMCPPLRVPYDATTALGCRA